MKKNQISFVLALIVFLPGLFAQWQPGNFKSSKETILPEDVFVAGKDAGNRPYYITKVEMDGIAYLTKISTGSTGVTVPRGNSTANLGVIGASNNPFLVYCGDVKWVSAIRGGTPANPVVVPTPGFGDVWIARVSLNSNTSGIGWIPVGESEAQYLDQGVIYRTNRYHVLTHANIPPPVVDTPPQQEQNQTSDDNQISPETRRVIAAKKPSVVVAPNGQNDRNNAPSNVKTGGITLLFVYENGKTVNGEETAVEVAVYHDATQVLVGTYTLSSTQGELPITDLAPGTYTTTIKASYDENNSGNREGWSMTIPLSASPSPFNFSIRAGMIPVERVMLLQK